MGKVAMMHHLRSCSFMQRQVPAKHISYIHSLEKDLEDIYTLNNKTSK